MRLDDLIAGEGVVPGGAGGVDVTSITADSRQVRPASLFVAVPGTRTDGARFIAEAVAKGAVAVLASDTASVPATIGVPVVRTNDPRRLLARAAARLYARQPAHMLAVTGTSGKTSVAEFTRQILAALGEAAASLGTMGLVTPKGAEYGSLTTPDPVTLHQTLDRLAGEGITHCAFEASSHGLDQRRLDGVRVEAAAFTNLGRDHLDYHANMDEYLTAKLRLFGELLPATGTAVVNADGEAAAEVIRIARGRGVRLLTAGRKGHDLALVDLVREGFEQRLTVLHQGQRHAVRFPLLGAYQVENALVAAGLAIAAGASADGVLAALDTLAGVKGRLEIVARTKGGLAVVDYAHKPEALAAVLDALRPFVTGELICVLGCGGDRDRGKRPIMGRIAAEKSDIVIVTDDNPRSEAPASIRAAILAGAPGALEIADRAEAIGEGVRRLGPGSVLVVAGKGHETGQIVGDRVLPFSDHEAVLAAIRERSFDV